MKDKNNICKKIRELRQSMKLTQSQFAELVNLSEDSIGKIERGVTIPNVETLYKIAEGVKIPIENLITSSKKNPAEGLPKTLTDLTTYLKTRPSEDIKLIHELAVKILERKK
ncbi:MAG: helix-turn-helix transcriptional regulator [Nitrospirae bacterium]|nr:helix-turn-helix transcriptional regulator [Nitrospirota bacterium]MBI3351217.1 helix-turn-helix transcriptional regulator [Nitrospirota bacterium]